MPLSPGNIEAGSSPAIRTLPAKPGPFSIFISASGRALHWVPMITSCAQTKRPVFKPAAENNRRYRRRPIARHTSSMSTSAWVPGPIWQPGMSIEQESSAAVKSKVELLPWIGLWARSWGKSLINLLAASFGSWTTARLIEVNRLRDKWPNVILIHTPVHASWLNQVEIYFSIVQRKVLTPNDFSSLQELQRRLLAFQSHYERSASPFNWTFTRRDLHALLAKIAAKRLAPAA
jgi:hypothetical protein